MTEALSGGEECSRKAAVGTGADRWWSLTAHPTSSMLSISVAEYNLP